MIVCSCNVLSDKQILATLASEEPGQPRSPAQAYRCLGCSPNCGRCLVTVRRLLADARGEACHVGCPTCPGAAHTAESPAQGEPARRPAHDTPANTDRVPLVAAE